MGTTAARPKKRARRDARLAIPDRAPFSPSASWFAGWTVAGSRLVERVDWRSEPVAEYPHAVADSLDLVHQLEEGAVSAVGDLFEVCDPWDDVDEGEPGIPALDLPGIAEAPLEQFGHASGRAGNTIEDQLATGELIGQTFEQLPDVGFGEVGQHALGDHEGGSVDRDLVQPAGVGGRGGEQLVSGMFGVEAGTEFDEVREVQGG